MLLTRLTVSIIIASYLVIHGLRRNSLSISGALAAFVVGLISFTVSYRFGIVLILFYYSGSKFTNFGSKLKARYEESFVLGGKRSALQVLANSSLATIVSIYYFFVIGDDISISLRAPEYHQLNLFGFVVSTNILNQILSFAYVAHYACAAGDTWSSEIGILSTGNPRLVTHFFLREVPRGTNGGMSLLGTAASMAGGLFIGLCYYLYDILFLPGSLASKYPIIILGALCGLLGSLFDSILGGLFQASYYSESRGCIVKGRSGKDPSIVHVCGSDVLSNEAVNFLSILFTMIFSIFFGPSLFCWLDSSYCLNY